MGSTRGGPDSALSPRALSRVPPVSSAVADALPFPLVTAVDQGLIVDLKLLVFSVSASYARLCASEPELAVAVTDRRVSQHSAELCVGVADAMGQHNLSKVRKGSWAAGEARGVRGVACRTWCGVRGMWCVACVVLCVWCSVACGGVRCAVCGVRCAVWVRDGRRLHMMCVVFCCRVHYALPRCFCTTEHASTCHASPTCGVCANPGHQVFSFHATIAESKQFARDASALLPYLLDGETEVVAVWGKLGSERIQRALARARDACRSIVANPRVLGTGIDAPAVDLVVMAKPSRSYVDIRQMVGRAARVSPGKREGFVLLPIHTAVSDGEGDEAAAGDGGVQPAGVGVGSNADAGGDVDADVDGDDGAGAGVALAGGFETAITVIRAMLETDESLQQRLSAALVESGRTNRSLDALVVLGPRVEAVGVPLALVREQLGVVLLRLGDPWDRWCGRLVAYAEEHGDCLVPRSYKTADGYRLGQWVATQRQVYKGQRGGLSASQVSRLEGVGMVWELGKNEK